jgi:acetyl/propionyl-CoA carboxylase alpha subunit/acetyl-CoA carboxylase carboxyltransferase component
MPGFRRLAIVNRGEAAMRAIHAVRDQNAQGGDELTVIALYTEPERSAMFVRAADEAFCLGPATFVDSHDEERKSGYLDYEALERALVATQADAAWVGWGFVAEQPDFPELCRRLGIVFVGPDADVMRRVGDKINSKLLAEETGVPVAAWSGGAVETVEHAISDARRIGLPLMVKATSGGGGRGIRRVDTLEGLSTAFESARAEALQAFGDGRVLLERLVTPARHVEVQVIADSAGTAWAVGLRDCSFQRRNQKVLEESACPVLTPEQEREIRASAARLIGQAGYCGAATVEFLYELADQRFSFMEVNARLQVEHPVTEMATGVDIVRLQLHVAAGGLLDGDPPPAYGHAIEARLNAEDPGRGFAPAAGRIRLLRLPSGPGIRVDAGVAEGDRIPAEFDSMIAKIIAWGATRDEALARLRRALAETAVVVEGGTTNRGFLLELLKRPETASGEIDTGWIDRLQERGEITVGRRADAALVQAAIELADQAAAVQRARFYAWAARGRPQADGSIGVTIDLRYEGVGYKVTVRQEGPGVYVLGIRGQEIQAVVERLSTFERRLTYAGVTYRSLVSVQADDVLVEVDGTAHRVSRDDGAIVRSPAPSVVVAIPVEPGDEVEAGDVVAVVESMKMELSLTAPFAGRVRAVLAGANVQVDAQEPLVQLDPDGAPGVESDSPRCVLFRGNPAAPDDPESRAARALQRLGWLALGYDIERAAADALLAEVEGLGLAVDDPARLAGELRILDRYADLRAVTRPHHDADADMTKRVRSPEQQYYAFLRSFDPETEGLRDADVARLERAAAHFGIASLDRSWALEAALHRVFVAEQRSATARLVVQAILDRWLDHAEALRDSSGEDVRDVLSRLVAAVDTRDSVLAELAREVTYRQIDEPLVQAARATTYTEMEAHVAALEADPEDPDRETLVRALVEGAQPLAPMLTARLAAARRDVRAVLLEVMCRRYYRVRALDPFADVDGEHVAVLASAYFHRGRRHHLLASYVPLEDLASAARAIAARAARAEAGDRVVADIYAAGPLRDPDTEAAALLETLEAAALAPALDRVVVAVADPDRGAGMSAVSLHTFRRAEDGAFREDVVLRGLHPMMAKRLQAWRLDNFDLERLPSAEDVYLFRATGRENPKDVRLVALAEVRDLTPLRGPEGRLVALPELERMTGEAVEGIRRYQAHRPPRERLRWNRILLHSWPPIDVDPDDLRTVFGGLGLENPELGIETVLLRGHMREAGLNGRERTLRFSWLAGSGLVVDVDDSPDHPIKPLDDYAMKVVQSRRRGAVYPYELVRMLAPPRGEGRADLPGGEWSEYDLDDAGTLVPVDRPPGRNEAGIVAGVVRSFTSRYPEGMARVTIFGDPTRALGSVAEPECRRIIAALDLAERLRVPLEWFALSAGAKIAMDSGTENMDWVGAVLRRLIEYTQAGGEANVVVAGINVGAQPYWNAEATMLMHCKGILVMTPDSAMVLTGKQALDYAGGVSAEDNFGIGGYERIMGPNGQAQFWAPDLAGACRILLAHYDHAYVAPGERFPRQAETTDPVDRDVRAAPHRADGSALATVGDIFSEAKNPGRKQPFDIRSVMHAVRDQDHEPSERWVGMSDAEASVVWDAHLGGWPVCMIAFESTPLPRFGPVPADGPDQWTAGTLFPRSAKKIARAINAASGNRPLVVLANLSGFDGSPESMRAMQLEFGAEIGRAVVNFDGPIVFCVISRYHGGAFVVFSTQLNDQIEALALDGAHASVIGGSAAAAVVFAREVDARTRQDVRLAELEAQIEAADGSARQELRARLAETRAQARSEHLGAVAGEFDAVHSVQRAKEMGSIHEIIDPAALRPALVAAVQRGIDRTELAAGGADGGADGRVRERVEP